MTKPHLGFDSTHYLPILKLKMGEANALRQMGQFSNFTPLLEVIPVGTDNEEGQRAITLAEHLDRQWRRISDLEPAFGGAPLMGEPPRPIFVDTHLLEDHALPGGQHPITYLAHLWQNSSLCILPVADYFASLGQAQAVRDIAARDGRGAVLRVPRDGFSSENVEREVDALLAALNLSPGEIDLVFDLRAVVENDVQMIIRVLRTLINDFPYITNWRSFALAGTAFPERVGDIPAGSNQTYARYEWTVWNALVDTPRPLYRRPAFGDYAVAHPDIRQNSGPISGSPQVRYTLEQEWIIYRGSRDSPRDICRTFCIQLDSAGHFRGPHFSPADNDIFECIQGRWGPGNSMIWRRIGTGQHLAYVISQLSAPRNSPESESD